jgi:hypothetical protein
MSLPDLDLEILECARKRRYERRRPEEAPAVVDVAFALPANELAAWVVRSELLRLARGMLRLLDDKGSVALVAHRRAVEVALRRWYADEVETGLVWLCTRGLCEGVRPEMEVSPHRPMRQLYRWTGNATEDRLRLTITGVR